MTGEKAEPKLPLSRKCELLEVPRSSFYAQRNKPSSKPADDELTIILRIDRLYTDAPYYGSRRITALLQREGFNVNRKRVQRLMRQMGIMGVAPGIMMQAPPGAQGLSLPAQKRRCDASESGLEYGHHLSAFGVRNHVPGGHHRLVQPQDACLPLLEHAQRRLLCGSVGRGLQRARNARNFQFRPGESIYLRCLHCRLGNARRRHQYGQSGAGLRQHLHRALLAQSQV